jgi:ornithine cyclodeaminase
VVIAVGSHEPDARELDSALLGRTTVVVEDDLVPMRDVVTGTVPRPADRPPVFTSVGMAWEDPVVAEAALAAADH